MAQGFQNPLQGLASALPRRMPGALDPQEAAATLSPGVGGGRANDPLQLAALRQAMSDPGQSTRSSLSDPGSNIHGLGGNPNAALDELEADPFTGAQAQAQQAKLDQPYQQAYMGGFRTPQEAAEASREAEAYKQNAPVRAQQAAGQYDLAKQQEASKGALDVEKERQSGFENRYGAMQDLLQGGGANNIRSINPQSGAMSFGAPQQTPTGIDQDVTNARQNLDKVKGANSGMFHPFGGDTTAIKQAESQLQSAIAMSLARHPADASFKAFAQAVASDPQYANMSLPEILQAAGEDQVTPEEMNQLQSLLYITRGR